MSDSLDIYEIRRILQLYFVDCLYHDEKERALRDYNPSINMVKEYDECDFIINHLRNELYLHTGDYTDSAQSVLTNYQIKLSPDDEQFKIFYREFLKVQQEITKAIQRRNHGKYDDEIAYLYGVENGLSSPVFVLNDPKAKPFNIMQNLLETIMRKQKQVEHGIQSGKLRKQEADLKYKDFDDCALELVKKGSKNQSYISDICQRRTKVDAGDTTLRSRVRDILKYQLSK